MIKDTVIAIETYLDTAWNNPLVPLRYQNETIPVTTSSWVDVSYIWGLAEFVTKEGRTRMGNTISLNLFTPRDIGNGQMLQLVDDIRIMMTQLTLTNSIVFPPSGPVTVPQDGKYIQHNISTTFDVFE